MRAIGVWIVVGGLMIAGNACGQAPAPQSKAGGQAKQSAPAVVVVKRLRCEYKVDPVGIDVRRPRLSWELESTETNVVQTSYEVRVGRSERELEAGKAIWMGGKLNSDASIDVEYGGPALAS